MSQVFDTSYDRTVLGTREELAKLLGLKSVALAKILKERNLANAGTVRTGTVGKPPTLFRLEDVRNAVAAHQETQAASRAAAAAARQLKKGVVPANTDEPQTIDSSEVTEVVAQTG